MRGVCEVGGYREGGWLEGGCESVRCVDEGVRGRVVGVRVLRSCDWSNMCGYALAMTRSVTYRRRS